jgi:hypothetical protein
MATQTVARRGRFPTLNTISAAANCGGDGPPSYAADLRQLGSCGPAEGVSATPDRRARLAW